MIPSLARSNPIMRRKAEWPEWPPPHQQLSGALFEPRPSLRRLTVLADAELLAEPDDYTLSVRTVLTGLLAHRYVKLLRYRDDGAFPATPRRPYGPPGAGLSAAEGWAELLPPDGRDGRDLLYADDAGPVLAAVLGHGVQFARSEVGAAAYRDLDPPQAADQRARDALAAEVAQVVGADLFVTERPYLFTTRSSTGRGAAVCRPADALAMIGLYLRSQGQFIIWNAADGSGSHSMNHGLYYWVGTRELLPTAWRWFSACVQESRAAGDDTLLDLGESLLRRVQRVLESRDRFHQAFNLPQNNDTARSVLTELDAVLVSLMGAVDASARVAHHVLGLPRSPHDAAWQRTRWLTQIAAPQPGLAALFANGTPLHDTLTILRLLRNTVHGQMMRTTIVQSTGRLRETAVRLPAADEPTILAAMDALGGRADWGVRPAARGASLVDPGLFIEQIVPKVIALLNEAMAATPVERLPHVHLTAVDDQPPSPRRAGEADIFGERNRLSIRWQLGF